MATAVDTLQNKVVLSGFIGEFEDNKINASIIYNCSIYIIIYIILL